VVGGAVLLIFALLAAAFLEAKTFLLRNPRFTLRTGQSIQVGGNRVVTRDQALAYFAPDIGRSILRVPLARRQRQLQQIPWVRNATVMRLWPNRVRIALSERTPVAFVRDGNAVRLVDDQGVLLGLPDAISQHYSFPVLGGISAADPLAIRAARVRTYLRFASALDAEGGNISAEVGEVDLSDPEDVRAVFSGSGHRPLVHFGTSDFLPRYIAYRAHLAEWLRQYPQLRSVDMRYGQQVVLDTGATPSAGTGSLTLPNAASAESPIAGTAMKSNPSKAGPAAVRHAPAAHNRSTHRTVHSSAAKRNSTRKKPERGHPVRNPIMHIVSGR
jgi:cell division protein FtsQ